MFRHDGQSARAKLEWPQATVVAQAAALVVVLASTLAARIARHGVTVLLISALNWVCEFTL